MKWAIELSEYGLLFEGRGLVRPQALVDFVAELAPSGGEDVKGGSGGWILSVDGASNVKGSRAGIILEGPDGVLVEQSLKFAFQANNNQAEYEALLAGMRLAIDMGVSRLVVRSDSQLVTEQVSGNFQARDPHLAKYLEEVRNMATNFEFGLVHVPRDQNARAYLLSKLASTKRWGNHRFVIQESLAAPSVTIGEMMELRSRHSWMDMYLKWFRYGEESVGLEAQAILRKNIAQFQMVEGKLYRRGFSTPLLRCVDEFEKERIMQEIHEGICGNHIVGRSLAMKVLRAGFFGPH